MPDFCLQNLNLQNVLPTKDNRSKTWGGLYGSAKSLILEKAAKIWQAPILLLTEDTLTAEKYQDELSFFSASLKDLLYFPDLETLPYDSFSPHHDLTSERLTVLSKLPFLTHGIVIVSITTLMHRLPPLKFISLNSIVFSRGQTIDMLGFRRNLEQSGYRHVSQVVEHGEFSVRGSIIDLFPMGSLNPIRLDFYDNDIERIRTFDPETQRSLENLEQIAILPAREFPTHIEAIDLFRDQWRQNFAGNPLECPIYETIAPDHFEAGMEYYLPLFFEHTATLLEYLPSDTLIVNTSQLLLENAQKFWQEISLRYDQLAHDRTRPILPPDTVFCSPPELFKKLDDFCKLQFTTKTETITFTSKKLPAFTKENTKESLSNWITESLQKNPNWQVLFIAESLGRLEALASILAAANITPKHIKHYQEIVSDVKSYIAVAPIYEGFTADDFALVTELELLGYQHAPKQERAKTRTIDFAENILRNLTELSSGDPIVHIDHGVGRYQGLKTITVDKVTDEYMMIAYADNTNLYVPVSALHLVSRYVGAEHAPFHSLGHKNEWDKAKQKAILRIRDIAAELLDIYAKRAVKKGFTFKKSDEDYALFAEQFPYQETPDQEQAIEQVLSDMCSEKTMDRLLCGDVGFGKTEVALRAAFLAVQNKKQVAVLVPTTLLADQHFATFSNRFTGFAITVEVLSRFKSVKQQKTLIDHLKNGKIDIIIGTHRLLQKDVKFHDLGLLIIDEEHRFGVKQKERFKAMRAEVDILTLTATPIPRTLGLAFAGIRDFSVITTPPKLRLAIKTFVYERKDSIIQEAISRELQRGGQVFFLHNTVETTLRIADDLRQLFPQATIAIAHGQMPGHELEEVMRDFYHRKTHVLVCTTIIENGLDIPTANTILIDRADRFGLAQLHQLRGRVGRSHHQAYAYLLVPSKKALAADAKKRLDAIAALEDLGIGFTLATHDLEIRGAGEILGEKQSGHIQEVGFHLFTELLDRTVQALKEGRIPDTNIEDKTNIEIRLGFSALIPEDYLPDVSLRLILYKRIAEAKSNDELADLRVEMIDRFGLLREPTKRLFEIAELKLQAMPLGIRTIEYSPRTDSGIIEFIEHPKINPIRLIELIQKDQKHYQLLGAKKLKFKNFSFTENSIISFLQMLIEKLAADAGTESHL